MFHSMSVHYVSEQSDTHPAFVPTILSAVASNHGLVHDDKSSCAENGRRKAHIRFLQINGPL